jgi:ribosomal protein L28
MKIDKEKSKKKIEEVLKTLGRMNTPLSGNNRSFSCKASKRIWSQNKQKVTINGKVYQISPRVFKTISKKINS